MLTRFECEKLVNMAGKFEGEPPWTPYFYYFSLMTQSEFIDVIQPDIAEFPELQGVSSVKVWEDENGFVFSELLR